MNNYLYAVALMAISTQVPRLIPGILPLSEIKNSVLQRFLKSIPLAALGALIFPGVLQVGGHTLIGVSGGVLSLLLALKKVNILLNILCSTFFVSALIYLSSV